MAENQHIYAAIDLKSFYASVECVSRKLDTLTTMRHKTNHKTYAFLF